MPYKLPCAPYPDDASYKTIALWCPRCDTHGECWRRYLAWEKALGINLNKKDHPAEVDNDLKETPVTDTPDTPDTPKKIVRGIKVPPPGDVPLYIDNDLALLAAEMVIHEPDGLNRLMIADIHRMARVVTRSVTHTMAEPLVTDQSLGHVDQSLGHVIVRCTATGQQVFDCDYCQGRLCSVHPAVPPVVDVGCYCDAEQRHGNLPPRLARCANHGKADCPTCGAYLVIDQPPPIATGRMWSWSLVMQHTEKRRRESAYGTTGVVDRVILDMKERHRLGVERYGVPLQAGNGRNHLVDAYQEALDLAAYLATELEEHGLGLDEYPPADRYDQKLSWHLRCVQVMFYDTVTTIVRLRALMEDKHR